MQTVLSKIWLRIDGTIYHDYDAYIMHVFMWK